MTIENRLGPLAKAACCHEAIDIGGEDANVVENYLRQLIMIRKAEQKLAEKKKAGLIGGPVHLGVGQEAVAVGVSAALRPTDRVFGGHRSHSHLLALGASLHGLFSEVLGKATGHSKGMGGSMHLWDEPHGFYGSVPIVAGTISLAVGAALAAKIQRTSDIAVSYFGDGAVEEGVFHESLNLARNLNVPILFVAENNLFASHMHVSLRGPMDSTVRFAAAHDIPFVTVDGNDVVAVAKAARNFAEIARAGGGPGFLEAVTYRWYGHVDWREDIDVGIARSADELAGWRGRDPVRRLCDAMVAKGIWSEERTRTLRIEISDEVDAAWERAMRQPYPPSAALLDHVYAD